MQVSDLIKNTHYQILKDPKKMEERIAIVYGFMVEYQKKHGYCPGFRQITSGTGIHNEGTKGALGILEKRGKVKFVGHGDRKRYRVVLTQQGSRADVLLDYTRALKDLCDIMSGKVSSHDLSAIVSREQEAFLALSDEDRKFLS